VSSDALQLGTFRSAFAHRSFSLIVLHYGAASTAIGILSVVVSIELYERGGSAAWASAGILARVLPFVLCSPIAGVIGDRYDGVAVVRWTSAAATGGAGALVLIGGDVPLWLLLVVGLAAHVAWTPAYPTTASLVPRAVDSESLAPAVGIVTAIESISWFVGPGLGGLLISAAGPRPAAAVAVVFAVVAVAIGVVIRHWQGGLGVDRPEATPHPPTRDPFGRMFVEGVRTVFGSPRLRVPLALLLALNLILGASQVVLLVAATSVFGLSEGGFGLLSAAMSGGALAALLVINPLARARRQVVVLVGVVVAAGAPIAVCAAAGSSGPVVPLLVVSGLGMTATEVLLLTTLQRNAPLDQLSRLFGILDSLLVGSLMVGTVIAAPLVELSGVRASLVAIGALLPLAAVAAVPSLRANDEWAAQLAAIRPRIELLGGLRLTRHAPRVVVEALAVGATERSVGPGIEVVRQGDRADAFYAVVVGELDITVRSVDGTPERVAVVGPGDGFGELGLLHDVPRQATVTTTSEVTLLEVPGELFLRSVGPGRVTGGGAGVAGSLRDLWSTG
jgi:MFS family permease